MKFIRSTLLSTLGLLCILCLVKDTYEVKVVFSSNSIFTYRVEYSSKGRADLNPIVDKGSGQWSAIESSYEGYVSLYNSSLVNDEPNLIVDFSKLAGWARSSGSFSQFSLKHPVQFDPLSGKILFPESIDPVDRSFVRHFLASLSFESNKGNSRQWTSSEVNPQGEFEVTYCILSENPDTIEVEKIYGKQLDYDQDKETKRNGKFVFSVGKHGSQLERLTGSVHTSHFLGNRLVGEDQTDMILILSKDSNSAILPVSGFNQNPARSFAGTLRGKEEYKQLEIRLLENLVGNASDQQIFDEMTSMEGRDFGDTIATSQKLVALLKLRPRSAFRLLDLLTALEHSTDSFKQFCSALNAAGTEEAQRVLIELIRRKTSDPETARRLIPYLSTVKTPIEDTKTFLEYLAEAEFDTDIRDTARLGLGSIGRRMGANSADELLQNLAQKLADARDSSDVSTVLLALGNLGHKSQIELVLPFTKASNESIKYDAIDALRHINSPEAKAALMEIATHEQSERGREVALEALSYNPGDQSTLSLYKNILETSESVPEIQVALKNASNMIKTYPEAREIIKKFMQRSGSTRLISYAENLLAGIPEPM